MNGCGLLALCVYTLLEAIPRLIVPAPPDSLAHNGAHSVLPFAFHWLYIVIAATGLGLNLLGTIVFALVGANAHGHSHGDSDHSHDHDAHDDDDEDEEEASAYAVLPCDAMRSAQC